MITNIDEAKKWLESLEGKKQFTDAISRLESMKLELSQASKIDPKDLHEPFITILANFAARDNRHSGEAVAEVIESAIYPNDKGFYEHLIHAKDRLPVLAELFTAPQQAIPVERLAKAESILKHFVDNSYCQDVGGGDLTVTTCEALEMATAYLAAPTAPIDNVNEVIGWVHGEYKNKLYKTLDAFAYDYGDTKDAVEALIPSTQL
jgi:hypothetical protein